MIIRCKGLMLSGVGPFTYPGRGSGAGLLLLSPRPATLGNTSERRKKDGERQPQK